MVHPYDNTKFHLMQAGEMPKSLCPAANNKWMYRPVLNPLCIFLEFQYGSGILLYKIHLPGGESTLID